MKDIGELETMTLWDIVTNEGALTQLVLGVFLFILGIAYSFTAIYYKLKFKLGG